jgi:DNA primase
MTRNYSYEVRPEICHVYESEGLVLTGQGKWKVTNCVFHGGSDSMRINGESGAFKCIACGARGDDEVTYFMHSRGIGLEDAIEVVRQIPAGDWHEELERIGVLSPAIEQALFEMENEHLKNDDSSNMEGDA